jgi:hypothetical protein
MSARLLLACALVLSVGLGSCRFLKKKEDSAPAATVTAAPPPVAPAPPPVASTTVAPVADPPTTEDYEEEAFEKITAENFEGELTKLEKELE